ncbi:site-specific integrase [Psychrobacter sp. FDAARGOS_221]|uniref:site-specific integrase n=1 Tax=Psychrobacter sp. FDAARGOS_221 TaxID=1975705 RepID=UPI000BB59FD5|nr:site-specific integrase [Psychrobacter sp. FDAARGOS_221]PNK61527.1 site-specific integrase [Psychrobacter sp. FDAARGOS_221]
MASINSRNNKLYIDFRYFGKRCREQTLLTDTKANRKRLANFIEKMEAEIKLGSFEYEKHFPQSKKLAEFKALELIRASNSHDDANINFEKFSRIWLEEMKPQWRPSQIQNVEDIFRIYLYPKFGMLPINTISKAMIMTFRGQLVKNGNNGRALSASRINHIMTPLRMLLVEASDRYEFESPWKNIKPLSEPKSKVSPFTLDEVVLILNTVRKDFKAYYTVRFFTGMRTGEIDGLPWRNIDFERRQIIIDQAIVNGVVGPTKTAGSNRIVQMNQLVYDALLEQRERTQPLSDFVFCTKAGTPLNHRNVTKRVWYPLLRYLGLEKRNPYQTRHTAATLWLAAGESPEWIASQLGHSSTKMLFTVYSRYVPNLTRQDGSAFDKVLENYNIS